VFLNLFDVRRYDWLLIPPKTEGERSVERKKNDEEYAGGRIWCSERHYVY
jgi:hypothetical protein